VERRKPRNSRSLSRFKVHPFRISTCWRQRWSRDIAVSAISTIRLFHYYVLWRNFLPLTIRHIDSSYLIEKWSLLSFSNREITNAIRDGAACTNNDALF
jgi:hypothetical protein